MISKAMWSTTTVLALAMTFAGAGVAQQNESRPQSQGPATPSQTMPGMPGGSGMMMMGMMMGQMTGQNQQMSDNMNKMMQNMTAIQNEKDPAKIKALVAQQQAMMEQMRAQMMQQGGMMQKMSGTMTNMPGMMQACPMAGAGNQPPAAK